MGYYVSRIVSIVPFSVSFSREDFNDVRVPLTHIRVPTWETPHCSLRSVTLLLSEVIVSDRFSHLFNSSFVFFFFLSSLFFLQDLSLHFFVIRRNDFIMNFTDQMLFLFILATFICPLKLGVHPSPRSLSTTEISWVHKLNSHFLKFSWLYLSQFIGFLTYEFLYFFRYYVTVLYLL